MEVSKSNHTKNTLMPAAIPSVVQLERAIKIAQKIQKLEAELTALIGQPGLVLRSAFEEGTPRFTGKRKYTFSPETLAKRAAQKNAEAAGSESDAEPTAKKTDGKMSAEGRAAIAAAQKARWAKAKAEGKGKSKSR